MTILNSLQVHIRGPQRKDNAILMPHIIRFNRRFTDKYDRLEKQLGISDIASKVSALNASLDIPANAPGCTEAADGVCCARRQHPMNLQHRDER